MILLFAQADQNDDDNLNPFANIPDEMMPVFIAVMIGFIFVALVIAICFLLTLSRALSRCSPRNRAMEPGMVWLNLIPLFNIVWQFVTVNRVADSLGREFADRGMRGEGEDYGRGVGMAYCVLNLLGVIPFIGGCFALAGLVCFIVYWVKVATFSGQLIAREDYYDDRGGRRDEADDGYDDRPWERR